MIFDMINNLQAKIISQLENQESIPTNGYDYAYLYYTLFQSDYTIQVTEGEPEYPRTLTIESEGNASTAQPYRFGVFKLGILNKNSVLIYVVGYF